MQIIFLTQSAYYSSSFHSEVTSTNKQLLFFAALMLSFCSHKHPMVFREEKRKLFSPQILFSPFYEVIDIEGNNESCQSGEMKVETKGCLDFL
jgi:hypothetical protein